MASVSSLSDSGAPSRADDAFIKRFDLSPASSGPLDGLTFAAKDLMDISGYVTGCGNPTWAKTHGPAVEHAICVQLLLNAGARCLGKTITDEFAFSLVGENHFYGTPRNALAPDRIPGGSSAGSASAVAAGEVDFALGTDTAGSVRVPAASCGLYGLRPTWGRLPMAGIQPLAPSFDTLGAFARTPDVLRRVAGVLYPSDELPVPVTTVLVLEEGWELVDENVRAQLPAFLARLEKIGLRLEQVRLAQLAGGELGQDIAAWKRTFSAAQWPEVRSVYAGWLQHAAPRLGPRIADNFALTETLDRSRLAEGLRLRATARHQLRAFLQPGQVLCLPAIPCPPPLRGQVDYDRTGHGYLARTLCLTAFAGLAGLPQLVLPADTSDGLPMGFSFLGVAESERSLISVAEKLHEK